MVSFCCLVGLVEKGRAIPGWCFSQPGPWVSSQWLKWPVQVPGGRLPDEAGAWHIWQNHQARRKVAETRPKRGAGGLGNHGKPLFVGIYRGIITPWFLRWCRISSIHSRCPFLGESGQK